MIGIFNSIVWTLDPVFFSLGPLQVRYYGLLFATGFMLSFYIVSYFYKKADLPVEEVDKLTVYVIIGAVLGARFGHVFFYSWDLYEDNLLEILKVWHGGLASHGGVIGVLLAVYVYSRNYHRNYIWTLDRIAIPSALTGALIRLGNLMNSEIYGTETALPWGFIYRINGETLPKHPTQIYEAIIYLIISGILWLVYKKADSKVPRGKLFGMFLTLIFGMRFFVEFIKYHQSSFIGEDSYINMGQLLSIPMILIGIYFWKRSSNQTTEP